jgi:hypothetical protein
MTIDRNYIKNINASFKYNQTTYNVLVKEDKDNYVSFLTEVLLPPVDGVIIQKQFNWTVNITQKDNSVYTKIINGTQNIVNLVINNCSDTVNYDKVMNVLLKNETNQEFIDGDLDITFTVWLNYSQYTQNYSFSHSPGHNLSICIKNAGSLLTSNIFADYKAPGYSERTYYVYHATLDTSTIYNLSLLLLTEPESNLILMYVHDQDGKSMDNALVETFRYYPSENTYRSVQKTATDYAGLTGQYLTLDTVNYKFSISRDGIPLPLVDSGLITNHYPIHTTTLYFTVNTEPGFLGSYLRTEAVTSGLTFNNNTNTFTFTYTDPTSIALAGCMAVYKTTIINEIKVYDDCLTTPTGTLSYTIPGVPDGNYKAEGYIRQTGSDPYNNVLNRYEIDFGENKAQLFGAEGLVFTLIFFVALVCVGFVTKSLAVPLIFGFIGLVGALIIGMIVIKTMTLIGVILLIGIVIFKLEW